MQIPQIGGHATTKKVFSDWSISLEIIEKEPKRVFVICGIAVALGIGCAFVPGNSAQRAPCIRQTCQPRTAGARGSPQRM